MCFKNKIEEIGIKYLKLGLSKLIKLGLLQIILRILKCTIPPIDIN